MNRPWMPLYIADYLADTAHLNAAQSGGYLHLIMHYWQTGGLPNDEQALARIARMTPAEWRRNCPIIADFFADGWQHKRIDLELAHAEDISSKRRAAAEQRYSKPNANAEPLDTHARASLQPQSQSESSSLRSEVARVREAPPYRKLFDEFWNAYPHKVGKTAAYKAFLGAMKTVDHDRLMFALHVYVNKTDDRPWCNPATWLNQGRWDDQPAPEVRNGRSITAAAARFVDHFGGPEAVHDYVPGSQEPKPLSLDFGPSPAGVRLISKG